MSAVSVADLIHRGPWYKNRGLVALNLCLGLSLITSYTNGYDASMINGLQIVPDWQHYFHNPSSSILGLTISAQNIGALLALPLAPFASDKLGRRKALFIGAVIMLAGVGLQTMSTDVAQFIVSRGLIGFGLCFATNAAPLLIVELAYPTQRSRITASYNSSWYIGSIIAAWVTFGSFRLKTTWAWRLPSVLQAIPSLLQVIFIWFTPESPRWLISKGRDEEAIQVLATYHANGSILDPLVQYEYMEIRDAMAAEKELMNNTSYLTLFATKGNLKRMRIIIALGFFSQWSGKLISYYISIVLDNLGFKQTAIKTLINACLQVFNFIMAISAALLVDRIGRRRLFLISNAGMFVMFAVWTAFTALYMELHYTWAGNVSIALIFLFFGFYDIAYSPLLVTYSVEILPFNIRAKGFAVMNLTVAIALVFNQYVNPVALDRLGWKYYLFYCAWLVFEFFFIYFFLYETRGRTLEQTAVLFDGDPNIDPSFDPFDAGVGAPLREMETHELTSRTSLPNISKRHQHQISTVQALAARRESGMSSSTGHAYYAREVEWKYDEDDSIYDGRRKREYSP